MAGVPAKVLKYRFDEETIAQLLKSKWWDLSDEELEVKADIITNVHAFLKELQSGK